MMATYCSLSVHGHSTDAPAFPTAVSYAVLHGGQLFIHMSSFPMCPSCSRTFLYDWTTYQPSHGIENLLWKGKKEKVHMSRKKELAVDDSECEDLGLTVVYVFCGFLVILALRKLVLLIVTYAEAIVMMVAEHLLEEQLDRMAMNFARPSRVVGRKNVACDADEKDVDEIDGGRGPMKSEHAWNSGERRPTLDETFGRPVQGNDDSSDDNLDEDALSDREGSTLDGLSNIVKVVLDSFAESLQASHPALDTRDTSRLFGELLGACGQLVAATFADVLDRTGARSVSKMSEGKHSDVFRVRTPGGIAVLKVLHVEYIDRYAKQLCNHLVVSRALERLTDDRGHNFTTGFVLFTRALCVWDGYPRELSDACLKFAAVRQDARPRSADPIIAYRQVPQPYLVLQMDYAGIPLSSMKAQVLSTGQAVSIFRQVILTLAAAEAGLNFEHRHLSLDSVYVATTQRESVQWKVDGQWFDVPTRGVVAYVADFSAARVDIDGETEFTDPLPLWQDCDNDAALKDIHRMIGEDMSDGWGSHCPRTNVLFAYHVTRELAERVAVDRHRSGYEEEEAEWNAFLEWKFRLPWFPSVALFACTAFASRDDTSRTRCYSTVVAKLGRFVTRSLSSLVGENG
ncbi:serine/threonine-protein kinase haspin homolog isoform X2 [Dermacentor albipictus]|uniref:serine/threonine-protein kinase haspin homolog isoform X2 n=1 Tax=Dermacentor albipictus TaxID=60249 RepID=UPI0038FC2D57